MPRENKHLKALTFRMNLALEKRRAAEAEIRLLQELIKDCQPTKRAARNTPTQAGSPKAT